MNRLIVLYQTLHLSHKILENRQNTELDCSREFSDNLHDAENNILRVTVHIFIHVGITNINF